MKGYVGKLLYVNLSNNKIINKDLNIKWARQFIGGKGLGARYLYEELPVNIEPLSPENILIFMTGPLTGTGAPACAKYTVITKSPLTGTFLDCYVGGHYPAEMKFAGFDGIIIKGRAKKWSYLLIEDGQSIIKDAVHLVGRGAYETTKMIKEECGSKDIKVATIGPAGENLVKISCITSELHHQAARGGVGAVMGSKKLKAVAVIGTNRKVDVHDEDKFKETVHETIRQEILENPALDWLRSDGTPAILRMTNDAGILPTRNFQEGEFEFVDNIDAAAIKEHLVRKNACYRCPIACRNVVEIRNGKFKGLTIEGPEYETLALIGSNCGIGDLGAIVKYNDLCDDLGLDTMSAGNLTAFAMECFEKGIISKEDTMGMDLLFGSVEGYLEIPKLISYRKGIGAKLAEGVKSASEKIGRGSERFALHVKGLEYPGYDPRGSIGMALAYATSDRGACHLRSWPVEREAFGDMDRFSTKGKASLVIDEQNRNSVKWSFIFCDLYPVKYATMARLYNLVTGRNVDYRDLRLIGERIWNLIRIFNVREGFSKKHDTMPIRIEKEPLWSRFIKGKTLSKNDFMTMLNEYYHLRGWTKDGVPTIQNKMELNLSGI